MLQLMTKNFDLHASALQLRAERQKLLASNIANADTPGYRAMDFHFSEALTQATTARGASQGATGMSRSSQGHLGANLGPSRATTALSPGTPLFRMSEQASLDGNTVDMDRERANFLDNSLRYEATLRFMNGSLRQMQTAIKGE